MHAAIQILSLNAWCCWSLLQIISVNESACVFFIVSSVCMLCVCVCVCVMCIHWAILWRQQLCEWECMCFVYCLFCVYALYVCVVCMCVNVNACVGCAIHWAILWRQQLSAYTRVHSLITRILPPMGTCEKKKKKKTKQPQWTNSQAKMANFLVTHLSQVCMLVILRMKFCFHNRAQSATDFLAG